MLRWCTDKIPSLPNIGTSPSEMELRRSMEMTNQFLTGSSIGYRYGYMEGVVDAYDGRTFCLPDGTTAAQFDDVAIRYLGRWPVGALQGRNAARMVAEALEIAYPCR